MIEHEPDHSVANREQTNDPVLLEWITHPMKRRPMVTAAVTLFIMLITMFVYYAMESRAFAVLALIVLLGSLAKYFLPTKFTLTESKIIIKSTTQTIAKPWSMFRSFYPDKNGVLISPFAEPSRLENFRGLYLMFSENRDEVLNAIREKLNNRPDESGRVQ